MKRLIGSTPGSSPGAGGAKSIYRRDPWRGTRVSAALGGVGDHRGERKGKRGRAVKIPYPPDLKRLPHIEGLPHSALLRSNCPCSTPGGWSGAGAGSAPAGPGQLRWSCPIPANWPDRWRALPGSGNGTDTRPWLRCERRSSRPPPLSVYFYTNLVDIPVRAWRQVRVYLNPTPAYRPD